MRLDPNLLDTNFVHIDTATPDASHLALLAEASNNYLIITNPQKADDVAKVISRRFLAETFLAQNFPDRRSRSGWISELEGRPERLPQFIAQTLDEENQDLTPLI